MKKPTRKASTVKAPATSPVKTAMVAEDLISVALRAALDSVLDQRAPVTLCRLFLTYADHFEEPTRERMKLSLLPDQPQDYATLQWFLKHAVGTAWQEGEILVKGRVGHSPELVDLPLTTSSRIVIDWLRGTATDPYDLSKWVDVVVVAKEPDDLHQTKAVRRYNAMIKWRVGRHTKVFFEQRTDDKTYRRTGTWAELQAAAKLQDAAGLWDIDISTFEEIVRGRDNPDIGLMKADPKIRLGA